MTAMENLKILDLNRSVYELCTEYPELLGILRELGFNEISSPGMLATVGRYMTIPMGAQARRIGLAEVIARLERACFVVVNA